MHKQDELPTFDDIMQWCAVMLSVLTLLRAINPKAKRT